MEAEVAWTSGKAAADLGSLLGLATGRPGRARRGCWPGEGDKSDNRPGDAKERRGCWPDASDLPTGEIRPADAIREIMRGRRV
jgi:hypothetical protein